MLVCSSTTSIEPREITRHVSTTRVSISLCKYSAVIIDVETDRGRYFEGPIIIVSILILKSGCNGRDTVRRWCGSMHALQERYRGSFLFPSPVSPADSDSFANIEIFRSLSARWYCALCKLRHPRGQTRSRDFLSHVNRSRGSLHWLMLVRIPEKKRTLGSRGMKFFLSPFLATKVSLESVEQW